MFLPKLFKLRKPLNKMEYNKFFTILGISLLILTMSAQPVSANIFEDIFGGLGQLVGYDPVYKQNWGVIECVKENQWDSYTKYTDDYKIFNCDKYTDECLVEIYPSRDPGFQGLSVNYEICNGYDGQSCGREIFAKWSGLWLGSSSDKETFILKEGQSVRFSPVFLNARDMGSIKFTANWKNYYIRGQENGKVYRQESCILNSALKRKVLSDGLNELQKSGGNSYQNYMIDFVSVATKTYKYSGNEVICQARQLHDIDFMTFKDGSTKKVQGEFIKGVECCPSESNCDDDTFKFIEEKVRECNYDSECSNGGSPVAVSGTSYVKYQCLDYECKKSSDIYTDCTNNAICISKYGANSVCDLSSSNWGNCKTSSTPISYCGDGSCDSINGETKITCPVDCGEIPKESGSFPWLILFFALIGGVLGYFTLGVRGAVIGVAVGAFIYFIKDFYLIKRLWS